MVPLWDHTTWTDLRCGLLLSVLVPGDDVATCRVHVFGAYLIVGVTLWLLWREYKGYVELRHQYLTLPQPQQYTIMVRQTPFLE